MVKKTLGKSILFVTMIGLIFWWITKADTTIKTFFGMSCEITRIPVSWISAKTIFDPSQYTDELAALTKKWYNRIDLIKEFVNGDQMIKVLLGEKCNLPVLRINQEESVNDIWIDHIEKRGNSLLMYGAKDWYATLIACDLATLKWNSYKPFDAEKQSVSIISTPTVDSTSSTTIQQWTKDFDSKTSQLLQTPLVLEKKNVHPQDAFLLMKQPVSKIITFFGGNWKRDRKILAETLNIANYIWTKEQNLQIRSYLLSYITIQFEAIETTEIELSVQEYQSAQQKVVSDLAKMRGYTRKYDRRVLFQEIGEDISSYKWTRNQNIKIRNYLLTKTKTKN